MNEEIISLNREQLKALQVAFEHLKPLFGLLDNAAKRCKYCNEVFLPTEPKNEFCSKSCQKQAWNEGRARRNNPAVQDVTDERQCVVPECENKFSFNANLDKPFWCRSCYALMVK